jgi:hypothetical protein
MTKAVAITVKNEATETLEAQNYPKLTFDAGLSVWTTGRNNIRIQNNDR